MDAATLKNLATEHCKGFSAIADNSKGKSIDELVAAYCSYFNTSNFTVYNPTGAQTYHTTEAMRTNMRAWLNTLVKNNMDPATAITMKDIRVEVFSSRVAFCWITNVFNPSDAEAFEFVNFHEYRVPIGADKGAWDFMVSDHQFESLMEKYPKFFQGEGAPVDAQGDKELS